MCENSRTITRQELESRVLDGLKDRLLEPDLVKEFVCAFNAELERSRASAKSALAARARKLADIERKIGAVLRAIEDGMYHPTMKERMVQLETERAALASQAERDAVTGNINVLIHPAAPELYRMKIRELEQLLENDGERQEARELIRSMIDKVVLTPREDTTGLDATLYGELAAILAACSETTQASSQRTLDLSQLSVVAVARNRLNLLFDAPGLC